MARTHANRGKGWEKSLEQLHALYQSSGRAVAFRNHPECVVRWSPKRPGHPGRIIGAQFRETGAPDYTLLTPHGAILSDAKHSNRPRWAFSRLEPHQANALWAVERIGHLGLLLIETPAGRWALPWSAVGPLWKRWHQGQAQRGQASLTPEQMTELALCAVPPGAALDYLSAAVERLRSAA